MDVDKIVLIISNIAVPIIVAFVTGYFASKKHKRKVSLINATAENKLKELINEYEHKIEIQTLSHQNELEKLKLQFEYAEKIEQQKAGANIIDNLTDKLSDEIIKQPATQKMINQRTTQNFLKNKGRGK